MCKDSYFGGYTNAFAIGTIENPYYFDFNSLYPYIM